MNHTRIYEYRFAQVDMEKKNIVWNEIANFLYNTHLNKPQKMLDPAGGLCEFINHIPSQERWTIDLSDDVKKYAHPDIKTIIGNNLEVELPQNYFDGVFISNFLEHLNSQYEVADFLERMFKTLKSKGRIVIMGPNFRYTYKDYFNFADHIVVLTELGVAEHLYGAGFVGGDCRDVRGVSRAERACEDRQSNSSIHCAADRRHREAWTHDARQHADLRHIANQTRKPKCG